MTVYGCSSDDDDTTQDGGGGSIHVDGSPDAIPASGGGGAKVDASPDVSSGGGGSTGGSGGDSGVPDTTPAETSTPDAIADVHVEAEAEAGPDLCQLHVAALDAGHDAADASGTEFGSLELDNAWIAGIDPAAGKTMTVTSSVCAAPQSGKTSGGGKAFSANLPMVEQYLTAQVAGFFPQISTIFAPGAPLVEFDLLPVDNFAAFPSFKTTSAEAVVIAEVVFFEDGMKCANTYGTTVSFKTAAQHGEAVVKYLDNNGDTPVWVSTPPTHGPPASPFEYAAIQLKPTAGEVLELTGTRADNCVVQYLFGNFTKVPVKAGTTSIAPLSLKYVDPPADAGDGG